MLKVIIHFDNFPKNEIATLQKWLKEKIILKNDYVNLLKFADKFEIKDEDESKTISNI